MRNCLQGMKVQRELMQQQIRFSITSSGMHTKCLTKRLRETQVEVKLLLSDFGGLFYRKDGWSSWGFDVVGHGDEEE